MRKHYWLLIFFCLILPLCLSGLAFAEDPPAEENQMITIESTASPSAEVPASLEVTFVSEEATANTATTEPPAEEGTSYKGVAWGSDFSVFKASKNFGGNLGPFSAAFIGTTDDNDIALLLGAPLSAKDANGEQRVRFEFVPRKFASVYFEPDDTHYIFYNGQFAMTFSRINDNNFPLYRDTFYKKYKQIGSFAKKYAPAEKKTYLLQSGIFEKGKTNAFLVKSQLTSGKMAYSSAKLVFASGDLLNIIRKEIEDKIAAEKLTSGEKEKHELQIDLNKIE
ncbi:MAG: hypothetical protein PHH14_02845 [Candidatus Margulisbacteria bacterium]|nr:hypothetical protein [Candidatus Margulisiibacteriota bacterium]